MADCSYSTVGGSGSFEYTEKKSTFIGLAVPVESESDALALVKEEKNRYPDARHHVWAYRLLDGGERYCDDGEPQGSGGIPMLEILRKCGLVNVLVVVTRYFGGILLGTGGLSRAYSAAAKGAVENAGTVTYERFSMWDVSLSYPDYQKLTPKLESFSALIDRTEFEDSVKVTFAVKEGDGEKMRAEITELFHGAVTPLQVGSRFDFQKT